MTNLNTVVKWGLQDKEKLREFIFERYGECIHHLWRITDVVGKYAEDPISSKSYWFQCDYCGDTKQVHYCHFWVSSLERVV